MRNRTITFSLTAIILLIQLLPQITRAQKFPSFTKFYLTAGFGAGTGTVHPSDIGLQTVIKNKLVLSLTSSSFNHKPDNQPRDYIPETITVLGLPITPSSSRLYSNEYTLSGGRFWSTGKKTWFIAEAGLSVLNSETSTYKRLVVGTPEYDAYINALLLLVGLTQYTPSNYEVVKQSKNGFGGMLRGQFTWGFANWAGMGVSSTLHANNIKSFLDIEFKLMIGLMNSKKGKN